MAAFVFTLLCFIGLFGLLLLMCGAEGTRRILWTDRSKGNIYFWVLLVLISIFEYYAQSILLPVLLTYIFLISWGRKYLETFYSSAIKGLVSILIMVLSEIIVAIKLYGMIENLNYALETYHDTITMLCALLMVSVQYLTMLFLEIIRSERNYRKVLLVLTGVKNIMALCLMQISLDFLIEEGISPTLGAVAAAFVLIDYAMYVIVVVQLKPVKSVHTEETFRTNAYEYYVHMEEEHIQIRRLYHDMKNQIMIMQRDENYQSEPIQKYLKNVEEQLDAIPKFYHTGNVSLDMLLLEARKKAIAAGVTFDAIIAEGCLSFMDDDDLNILFTNAIVNELEACEKITEGEKKIVIRAGRNLNDVLLCFKNTVGENHKKTSLFTSKKNKKMHGIGLSTIQKTAEKYQGYVSVIEEDNVFQLAILFAREKENEEIQK